MLPQQKKRRIIIQIQELLHPLSQSERLLKRPNPLPHPQPSLLPQIENRMISQIIEQHPLLLKVVLLLHPQFVAVKSLMIEPP